jgi:hypothetical protein
VVLDHPLLGDGEIVVFPARDDLSTHHLGDRRGPRRLSAGHRPYGDVPVGDGAERLTVAITHWQEPDVGCRHLLGRMLDRRGLVSGL